LANFSVKMNSTKMKAARHFFTLTLLVLGSVLLTFTAVEILYRILVSDDKTVKIVNERLYDTLKDKKLGAILKANHSYTARKYAVSVSDGHREEIYEVVYTMDERHRRTVGHQIIPDSPHVLLFGGSFFFGEGLRDEQTLQHQLKLRMPNTNIYNYAVHGWGTNGMLGVIESVDLPREVQSSKGIAIYGYLWFHEDRNIGSIRTGWATKFPYYEPDVDGNLTSHGTIYEGRPVLMSLNSGLRKLGKFSKLLSLINIDFGRWCINPAKLTAQIIIESKRRYEKMFDGEFIVLIHPLNSKIPDPEKGSHQSVLDQLAIAGIRVLHLPIETSEESAIPNDGHPSAQLNREIARELAMTETMRHLFGL